MYCNSCGSPISGESTVCSRCGTNIIGARADIAARTRVAANLQLVAIFWYVVGATFLVPTFLMLGFSAVASAALMHEPLFARIAGTGLFTVIALLCLLHAIACFVAGYGLHKLRPWGRTFAIVVAFWMLVHPPFGTALGIYTLVVLLPAAAADEYRRMSGVGGTAASARA